MLAAAEVNPFWWAQPVGTVIGALIVFGGVHATLKANRKMKRQDTLRDRAKERETALQSAYAEFAAAYLDRLASIAALMLHNGFVKDAPNHFPGDGPGLTKAMDNLVEDGRVLMSREAAAQSRICTAYSRLRLIDANPRRMAQLTKQFQMISGPSIAKVHERSIGLYHDLSLFIAAVQRELVTEYQRDADLAEDGAYPPMVVLPELSVLRVTADGHGIKADSVPAKSI